MSGLEKDFEGRAVGQNVDATTPEAKKAIRSLGFETHGIAIRSPEGKVLWKQADHDVNMDEVRKALKDFLK